MPDPLLLLEKILKPEQIELSDLASEYTAAEHVAKFYGVGVRREREKVFFEFATPQQGRLVARLDCDRYPELAPDLVFLDPDTHVVSADRKHWPPSGKLMPHPDGLHLCLPGTRWFEITHSNTGTRNDRRISRILEVLAVCCNGQAQGLTVGRRR